MMYNPRHLNNIGRRQYSELEICRLVCMPAQEEVSDTRVHTHCAIIMMTASIGKKKRDHVIQASTATYACSGPVANRICLRVGPLTSPAGVMPSPPSAGGTARPPGPSTVPAPASTPSTALRTGPSPTGSGPGSPASPPSSSSTTGPSPAGLGAAAVLPIICWSAARPAARTRASTCVTDIVDWVAARSGAAVGAGAGPEKRASTRSGAGAGAGVGAPAGASVALIQRKRRDEASPSMV